MLYHLPFMSNIRLNQNTNTHTRTFLFYYNDDAALSIVRLWLNHYWNGQCLPIDYMGTHQFIRVSSTVGNHSGLGPKVMSSKWIDCYSYDVVKLFLTICKKPFLKICNTKKFMRLQSWQKYLILFDHRLDLVMLWLQIFVLTHCLSKESISELFRLKHFLRNPLQKISGLFNKILIFGRRLKIYYKICNF